jgi:hypothetical protein
MNAKSAHLSVPALTEVSLVPDGAFYRVEQVAWLSPSTIFGSGSDMSGDLHNWSE